MFLEYKEIFFFNFYFLAQIQGAPKSNIKKKLTHVKSRKQKNQMVS